MVQVQNLDSSVYDAVRGELNELEADEEFLTHANPCHYILSTSAFNMSAIAAPDQGSSMKKDQELFHYNEGDTDILLNLCSTPIQPGSGLGLLNQVSSSIT
jgi:hypothetical protein